MEYAILGNTGLKVSRVGFGGAVAGLRNYLHAYDPKEEDQRQQVVGTIRYALSKGINYFDTAPGYGNGESEAIFGEALMDVDPNSYILATKTRWRNYKPGDIRRQIEESLTRLRRDWIDILQFHGDTYTNEAADMLLAPGSAVEEMQALKREGLIHYTGFTSEDQNEAVYRFIHSGSFDMMQICYNFLFQHAYEPNRPFGCILEAEKQGMGIVTMRAPTSGWMQKWIQKVNPENTFDYTPALIQFVLSNSYVDVALIGMRTKNRVDSNVAICDDLQGRINIEEMWKYYV